MWDIMTNSWWPFIIGGILIVILIGILLFLRSRKTDE
jgi:LPXTG-motif cell wall-anchored protein